MGNSNNKPEKQSKEDYLKNSPAILKINKLYEDVSKIEYENDLIYFARWQYYEPMGMDFSDRFELDKEAYIKTYHENGVHDYKAPFNETILIKKLIKNLEKAEHPYIQEYVEFLSKKLNTQNATQTDEQQNSIESSVKYWLSFLEHEHPRKHKIPLNESDYNKLVQWTIYYFENNKPPTIKNPIQFYNCQRSELLVAMKRIYKEILPNSTFAPNYLEFIVSCFSDLKGYNLDNIIKTKEPQYFDDLYKGIKRKTQ
ncbi:MAG: hypothetical protein LC109_11105 [Bacteroidia bacterium]|nr:hypothetical protein [Bacteroidia bacterium]